MAKRARGSVRPGQRRPGQRRPIDRRPAAPGTESTTPKTGSLSEAELARAAELEAQLLAEERAAEAARRRSASRAATREVIAAAPIANHDEYAYVVRDVKDIVRIATLLIGILILLWLFIDVFEVIPIG